MNCPVCGKELGSWPCKRCSYEPESLLGFDEAQARAREAKRIEAARAVWRKKGGTVLGDYDRGYRTELQRDPFEFPEEWQARLESKPLYAGKARLVKEAYDVHSGRFPLEVSLEKWVDRKQGSVLDTIPLAAIREPVGVKAVLGSIAITVERDEARTLYRAGAERELYAWLTVKGEDWTLLRLEMLGEGKVYPLQAWRAGKNFRDRFLNGRGQGPVLVALPGGWVDMGWKGSRQRKQVGAFALGKYPVTFEEWDVYAAAAGYRPADERWGRGKRPVINVNWEDACAYAAWLSQQTGQTYRLPGDVEWEYACRAGSETAYSFGDDGSLLAQYAWYGGNSGYQTHPVGEKKPNAFGLYDMHGNVWEWCAEVHEPGGRVARGGSWCLNVSCLRTAFRCSSKATLRLNTLGFRLARAL